MARATSQKLGTAHLGHVQSVARFSKDRTAKGSSRWTFGSYSKSDTLRWIERGETSQSILEAFNLEAQRWAERIQEFSQAVPSRRRKLRHRDVGDSVDVARYLDGNVDCWERLERGKSLPSVHLGINLGFNSAQGERDFVEGVIPAAACAWALCGAGYAVRVSGMLVTGNPPYRDNWRGPVCDTYAASWDVKDYRDPIDVGALLSMGLPGFLRQCLLGHLESVGMVSGYGCPIAPEREHLEALGIDLYVGRHNVVVGSADGERIESQTHLGDFVKAGR